MTHSLRLLLTAASIAVAAASAQVTPPAVPSTIRVEDGNVAYLKGHAVGTQNYTCVPANGVYGWKGAPQATLFVTLKWLNQEIPQQIITHFLSPNPNPADNGAPRPTWQSSLDTSAVWGNAIKSSTDSAYVAEGAIPWLLLEVVGKKAGPAGGESMTGTTFIHRVNTAGGVAPTLPCSETENLGVTKFVPYAADYYFYKAKKD
jgi:hypothetical protein